ncbi:hypothetical protein ABNX05_16735 [Lysinibacillus sp. M3]|uniref:Uncharacterized protein n=1 Tax=Lysinibacillus zambalensis TaxID=3160866 RepID=A0ABV1MUT6_9BACI
MIAKIGDESYKAKKIEFQNGDFKLLKKISRRISRRILIYMEENKELNFTKVTIQVIETTLFR